MKFEALDPGTFVEGEYTAQPVVPDALTPPQPPLTPEPYASPVEGGLREISVVAATLGSEGPKRDSLHSPRME